LFSEVSAGVGFHFWERFGNQADLAFSSHIGAQLVKILDYAGEEASE